MNMNTGKPSDLQSHERLTTHGSHGEFEFVAAHTGNSFDDESLTSSLIPVPRVETTGVALAGKTLAEIEQLAITETLRSTNGNKAMAARMLGISEKSIYNKMKRFQARVS